MTTGLQSAIADLTGLGLTLDDSLDQSQLDVASEAIDRIAQPLSSEDLRALISLLPRNGDTAFGLCLTLVAAVEASALWPRWELLEDQTNEWVEILRRRLANGGFEPPRPGSSLPHSST